MFTPKYILTLDEVEALRLATIKAITTPAGLTSTRDVNPMVTFLISAITLLPFIIEAIVPYNAPTAEDIFFLCLEAGEKYITHMSGVCLN